MTLEALGWTPQFEAAFEQHRAPGVEPARVSLEHTHIYRVLTASGERLARVAGRLRHAALDVFNTEPLPAGHPLTRLENVTLSAHSAFRTPEASDNLIRRALDIACDLARGE